MKVSARNSLPGVVKKVTRNAVNAEVEIEIAPCRSCAHAAAKDSAARVAFPPAAATTVVPRPHIA
jgi:molybdopterin-binding protein